MRSSMFKPSTSQINEYFQRSQWIADNMDDLIHDGKISSFHDDVVRIIQTNRNNLEALQYALQTGNMPGRAVFWLIKKTVDMNYKSVSDYINE